MSDGLWYPGSSAFFLDPDLFYGVEDPWRDMCWMHLDERPPLKEKTAGYAREALTVTKGSATFREKRDAAMAVLSRANDYESRGFTTMAAMLRDRAAMDLRNALIIERGQGR